MKTPAALQNWSAADRAGRRDAPIQKSFQGADPFHPAFGALVVEAKL